MADVRKESDSAVFYRRPQGLFQLTYRIFAASGRAAGLALIVGIWLSPIADAAFGQEPVFHYIRNRGNPTLFMGNGGGVPIAGPVKGDVTSAQWSIEPVPGEIMVQIRNRQTGLVLHTLNGTLELGPVTPDTTAGDWQVEPVEGKMFTRIKNAATGFYLALQEVTGPLSVVPLDLDGANKGELPPATAEWDFVPVTGASPVAAVVPPARRDSPGSNFKGCPDLSSARIFKGS